MARRGAVMLGVTFAAMLLAGCGVSLDLDGPSKGPPPGPEAGVPPFEPPLVFADDTFGPALAEPTTALALARSREGQWLAYATRAGVIYEVRAATPLELTGSDGILDAAVYGRVELSAAGSYVAWRGAWGGAGGSGPSDTETDHWLTPDDVHHQPRVSADGRLVSTRTAWGYGLALDEHAVHIQTVPGSHSVAAVEGQETAIVATIEASSEAYVLRAAWWTDGEPSLERVRELESEPDGPTAVAASADLAVIVWSETDAGIRAIVAQRSPDGTGVMEGPSTTETADLGAFVSPSYTATALAEGSIVVVMGGADDARARLLYIRPDGSFTTPSELPVPCRPLSASTDRTGLAVLCEADGGARSGLWIDRIASGIPRSEVFSLGADAIATQRMPRVSCEGSQSQCLIVWNGAATQAARFSTSDRTMRTVHTLGTIGPATAAWQDGTPVAVSGPDCIVPVDRGSPCAALEPFVGRTPPAAVASVDGLVIASGTRDGVRLTQATRAGGTKQLGLLEAAAVVDLAAAAWEGGVLVAWTQEADHDRCDLRAAHVRDGEVTDLLPVCGSERVTRDVAVASTGQRALLAWEESFGPTSDEPFVRTLLWSAVGETPIELSPIAGRRPAVTTWGDGFYLAWRAADGIRGMRLSANGTPMDQSPGQRGLVIGQPVEDHLDGDGDGQLAVAAIGGGYLLVVASGPRGARWWLVQYPGTLE